MVLPSVRILNGLAAATSISLILLAILYLQNTLGLPPCPLCIFQRIGFMAVALVLLIAALHGPGTRGVRVYGGLLLVAGLVGAGVALRHLWLQWSPPTTVAACGPGLQFMLDNYALSDALNAVFQGSGDCSDQHWSFLGFSIPGWSLIWFMLFSAYGALLALWGHVVPPARQRSD
ncbi:MAG: disulfide bond formation protein B [Natronospirillum sp.]|nr:disulfide bond formation protein B [Natronospirillum sp.]